MAITWSKEWQASDDGVIIKGIDLKNIQDDIEAGIGDAATVQGQTFDAPEAADDGYVVFWNNSSSKFDYKEVVDLSGAQTIAGAKTFSDAITLNSTFKLGTTNQGDVLYDNGTSIVRLPPGTAGQALTMNSGATAPEWGDPFSSNVVFDWGIGDCDYASGSYGMVFDTDTGLSDTGTADLLVAGAWFGTEDATYRNFGYGRFTKIAGINTLTIHGRIWRYNGSASTPVLQVSVGGQTADVVSSSTTPVWATTDTIDVSGLTDGVTYDIVCSLKTSDAGGIANCSRVMLIAS